MKSNTFLSQLGNYFEVYLPDVRKASPNTISSYGDSFAILFEFFNEEKNISHQCFESFALMILKRT